MQSNPYTPPEAPITDISVPKNMPYWHTTLLIWVLRIWGVFALTLLIYVLLTTSVSVLASFAPLTYVPLLAVPAGILTAAHLLTKKSRHAVFPLGLLPVIYVLLAISMNPELLNPANRQWDVHYFMLIPLPFRLCMLFFALVTMYVLILRKHGKLK